MVDPDILAQIPLFRGLSPRMLEQLSGAALARNYRAGEIIVSQSEPRRGFHVVLEGRVKVFKASPEGKEQTIYVFGAGEPFCLCAGFGEDGHLASAAALEPTRVLSLPPKAMEDLAWREPALLMSMVSLLSRRLKESLELIESLSLRGLSGRLAAFLLQAARSGEDDNLVRLHITQRELAKILNATPEALSRTLKKLSEVGLVENRGREIAILDWSGLEAAAMG